MGKNVILLMPPFRDTLSNDVWGDGAGFLPPLGLLYLATPLMQAGYKIKFIDLSAEAIRKDEFVALVKKTSFVLISCYTQVMPTIKKIIRHIKLANDTTKILCGGPHCNVSRSYIQYSDVTVVGEPDEYISEILDQLSLCEKLTDISGLIYKDGDTIVKTGGKLFIKDLDQLGYPALNLSKGKRYGFVGGLGVFDDKNIAPIMSTRGCTFQCKFCNWKTGIFRKRSVDNVVKEIKRRFADGYEFFIFNDDNITLDKKRCVELMDKIIESKMRIKMLLQGRVENADYQFFKKLRRAGCVLFTFGIESANQDVLDFYNKRTTVKNFEMAIKHANKAGIFTVGCFIIGASMETIKHFENNKRFVKKNPLDLINIGILAYQYGSELWDEMRAKNILTKEDLHVWANEKMSNFTYNELLDIQNDFSNFFWRDPRRILRIIYKSIRLGLFRLKGLYKGLKLLPERGKLSSGSTRYSDEARLEDHFWE